MTMGNSESIGLKLTLEGQQQFLSGIRQSQAEITKMGTDIASVSKEAVSAGKAISSVSLALGFEQATKGLGELATSLREPIDQAVALGESVNAVSVVFGPATDKVLAFGKQAAESAGLSQRAFNQLATPIGAALQNVGFSADQAAQSTIDLTQRAADLASVFNTDVSESMAAIQAGLRGEGDALERFGVGLTAAKVEARALADTGKDTAKSLTEQEKALARVALIMEESARVQGDFVNTSDSLANSQRILNAQIENSRTELANFFLPALQLGLQAFASLPPEVLGATTALVEFGPAIGQTAVGLKLMHQALGQNAQILPRLTKAALTVGPAIGGIGLAFGAAYLATETFSNSVPKWSSELELLSDDGVRLARVNELIAEASGFERDILEEVAERLKQNIETTKQAAETDARLKKETEDVAKATDVFSEAIANTNAILKEMAEAGKEAFSALDKFKAVPTVEQLQLESAIARVNAELQRQELALLDGTAAQAGNEEAVQANIDALQQQLDVLEQEKTVLDAERQATIAMGQSKVAASGNVQGLTQSESDLRQQVVNASNAMSDQEGRARNLAVTISSLISRMNSALATGDLMTAQEQLLVAGISGYQEGGVVPGRIGQRQLAVVHGGERVLTPDQNTQFSALIQGADRLSSLVKSLHSPYSRVTPTPPVLTYQPFAQHSPPPVIRLAVSQDTGDRTGVAINTGPVTIVDSRKDTGAVGDLGYSIVRALKSRGIQPF